MPNTPLILVDMPAADAAEEVTQFLSVRYTYRDAATGREADVADQDAVVRRLVELLDGDDELSREVERERIRVTAADDMAAARSAAERGQHAEAALFLEHGIFAVKEGAAWMGEDEECENLEDEMDEMIAFVADEEAYEEVRRAGMLSSVTSHQAQRAAFAGKERKRFQTKAMRHMVKRSQTSRLGPKDKESASSSAPAPRPQKKSRRK